MATEDPPKEEPKTPPQAPPAKKDETPGGESPPVKEPPKGKPKAGAEKYDLKLPEGSLLKPEALKAIEADAKTRGLSNEEAQAEVDRVSAQHKTFTEDQAADLEALQDSWIQEAKTDPEIGGEKFAESAELAKRVVDRFGTTELKDALSSSRLGDHPQLIKMLVRIGKSMSDDQLILPPSQPKGKKSPEEVFYGKTEEKEK